MLPVTAWMCVENGAKRDALLRKQEEVLNSNANLDAMDERITRMSEPGLGWLLLPLLPYAFWPVLRRLVR